MTKERKKKTAKIQYQFPLKNYNELKYYYKFFKRKINKIKSERMFSNNFEKKNYIDESYQIEVN